MAQQLYQWEVSQKKRMADGEIKNITAKQVGPKPPHAAKNVRRIGSPGPISEQERQQLEERDRAERAAALERHEREKAAKAKAAEKNRQAAEKLQRAAGDQNPTAAVEADDTPADDAGSSSSSADDTPADDAGSSSSSADDILGDDTPADDAGSSSSSADDTPAAVEDLEQLTKAELAELATQRGASFKSKATKSEIIEAIKAAE